MYELVALGTDVAAAEEVAHRLGASLSVNHEAESERRPYSTMVRAVTDDIDALGPVAEVGLHLCFRRVIKPLPSPPPPGRVVAAFLMVGRADLGHARSDAHWRDVHAPLALVNHAAMCDYTQLSVVATLAGAPIDGVALCAFADRDDLRNRFFNDDAARAVIEADVASFADTARSPRRVVLVDR